MIDALCTMDHVTSYHVHVVGSKTRGVCRDELVDHALNRPHDNFTAVGFAVDPILQ